MSPIAQLQRNSPLHAAMLPGSLTPGSQLERDERLHSGVAGRRSRSDRSLPKLEYFRTTSSISRSAIPSLDTPVEKGLVDESEKGDRTDAYALTTGGRRELEAPREQASQYRWRRARRVSSGGVGGTLFPENCAPANASHGGHNQSSSYCVISTSPRPVTMTS